MGTVLLGFPLHDADDVDDLEGSLESLPRTIIVQNEHDPFGSALEVTDLFAEHGPIDFGIETNHGIATHDYLDFEHIASLVDELAVPSTTSGD